MNPENDLLQRLDAYVTALRCGEPPDRQALLAEHPDAMDLVQCLDDLQVLAKAAAHVAPAEQAAGPPSVATLQTPVPALHIGKEEVCPGRPRHFGKYELLESVGRGGMGVVFRARQTDLDRIVALKMIVASELASPEQIARFEAEARAAAGLRHPHILQVFEAGCLDGQHYFTMAYIEGPSLAQALRQAPWSALVKARYLREVADAVAYLHSQGILHRDLKPANILLDAQQRAYVTDFGLMKVLAGGSDWTHSGAIVGTPSYMSPEQAAGRHAEVGSPSDVYSLGAILYEMLTGRPPFREATPLDTLVQVIESEPARPRQLDPEIPRELELICLKAMAKAPAERYPSAAALAEDLGRYLVGAPVAARPQDMGQRLVRWTRQEPGLASRLAILGACAAVAQAYYLWRHPVSLQEHIEIMGVLGIWAAVSVACQALMRRGLWADRVQALWLAADGILLTTALLLDEAFQSPLILGYGVYIVASGSLPACGSVSAGCG